MGGQIEVAVLAVDADGLSLGLIRLVKQAVSGHEESPEDPLLGNRPAAIGGSGGVTRASRPVHGADHPLKEADATVGDDQERIGGNGVRSLAPGAGPGVFMRALHPGQQGPAGRKQEKNGQAENGGEK